MSTGTREHRDEEAESPTAEAAPAVNLLRVSENGPLELGGQISVAGESCLHARLCRCGASQSKPFCDGSHAQISFSATGEPQARESQPLAEPGGRLVVVPVENGPLRMEGPLELCSDTGRMLDRTMKTWLCRCGQSGNKPWCDGTHKRTGFEAPGETPRRK